MKRPHDWYLNCRCSLEPSPAFIKATLAGNYVRYRDPSPVIDFLDMDPSALQALEDLARGAVV